MDERGHDQLSPQVRDTQRVPRSCIQCSKRKIKCSKTIPCIACTRRGDALSCTREVVRVQGKITVAVDPDLSARSPGESEQVLQENAALRIRVKQLETLLAQGVDLRSGNPSAASEPSSSQPTDDIFASFDSLQLTSQPDTPNRSAPINLDPSNELPDLLSLLPIRRSSERIVRFSIGTLGWVHCALNAAQFMIEHDAFWNGLESHDRAVLLNHSWLAVYMSVLAIGIYFMDEQESYELHFIRDAFSSQPVSRLEFTSKRMKEVSRTWYDAAFKELGLSDFLSTPNLCTVQTLAICTIVHRNFGEPDRDYFLLGVAINVARTLGMDRLGSEENYLQSLAKRTEWKDYTGRELGRRLWWTLIICDWMTVFSRPAMISSQSFNTSLSIHDNGMHNDDNITLATYEANSDASCPSPLHYHVLISKVAYVIYARVKISDKSSTTNILKALQDLNNISHKLPDHLVQKNQDPLQTLQDEKWPWIILQRSQINLVLNACRINICLAYLPQYLDTKEDKFNVHERGVDAARNVINHMRPNVSRLLTKFWGVPAATLAAGIYLALDLICFRGSKTQRAEDQQYGLISDCILILESMKNAATSAQGGPMILRRLLHFRSAWAANQPIGRHMLSQIMRTVSAPSTFPLDELEETTSDFLQDWSQRPTVPPEYGMPSDSNNSFNFDFGDAEIFNPVTSGMALEFETMDYDLTHGVQYDLNWLSPGISDSGEPQPLRRQFWDI